MVDLLFINDGTIPSERLALMRSCGDVVTGTSMGVRGSYRQALAAARSRGWSEQDLVWFSEDDYLYRASALGDLTEASLIWPCADYFALYASIGSRPPFGGAQPAYAWTPPCWQEPPPRLVNGHPWRVALSTTSTYGVRLSALREDYWVLRGAVYAGGAWDHATCLTLQGHPPVAWAQVWRDATLRGAPDRRGRLRRAATVPGRSALNFWAMRYRRRPRCLVAPEPSLATHLESAHLAVGTDWEAVAGKVERWAS